MCLVVLAHKMNEKYPVLLGANREESCVRPATGPCLMRGEFPRSRSLWAGQDRGPNGSFGTPGTWMGLNVNGFVVAVTNRDDGALHGPDKLKSRGLLVAEMLSKASVGMAMTYALYELQNGGYGGANFLIADAHAAVIIHARCAEEVRYEVLDPGLHVLTNLDINDPADVRIKLMKAQLDVADFEASAKQMLRHPEIVIHDTEWGTVASSIVLVGTTGYDLNDTTRFLHIPGKPVDLDYEPHDALVKELVAKSVSGALPAVL